jgi:hypothetical protein
VAFQPSATALVGHFKVAVSEKKAHRRKDRSAKIGVPLPAYHRLNIPTGLIRITSDTRSRINHWLLA